MNSSWFLVDFKKFDAKNDAFCHLCCTFLQTEDRTKFDAVVLKTPTRDINEVTEGGELQQITKSANLFDSDLEDEHLKAIEYVFLV